MDVRTLADFQENLLELPRQMRRCTETAQEIDRNTSPRLSDTVKQFYSMDMKLKTLNVSYRIFNFS